ncbi:hypothetical protein CONLIGDRAFT_645060 [Coniochaeta ligniaria NRRL 30616]|uniref:Uncharacterized protein n=1 Tax=Coniochaeta ligniaria NRRL 30616 TaxID=1408157 RepID=A0A1J7IN47_9PEZI|nr:hypothetical protein CONLIGDRAFT_645060 [Coniochaeta ligniaria NRRL 30616]
MDTSTFFRLGEAESFYQHRPAVPGQYLETVKTSDLKLRTLQYRRDQDDELASALLNDTTTMEQQATHGSKNLSAAGVGDAYAPKHTRPYVPEMVERFNGHASNNAISRANMNAFQTNRLQAFPGPSSRHRPSTAVQPKTTSRQRKGTVRYRRSSRGSIGVGPQQAEYQPASEKLDRSDLPQTRVRQPRKQLKVPKVQAPDSSDELPNDRRKLNRMSESVLNLTDATKLDPRDVMAVCRSKTTRESAKASPVKHRGGVLKKMTNALTDRLHLTHKTIEVEPHEVDELRGSGFYDYKTNTFTRHVVADIPTEKRHLPSRLAEIYERERLDQDAQQNSDDSFEWISGRKNTESSPSTNSSPSTDSFDDPFADPECVKRITTDFVNRLKATTPSKATRSPTPVTPSASPPYMETLMRGSVNSLLPSPPAGASTPRIIVSRRRSHTVYGSIKQSKPVTRTSASVLALSADLAAFDIGSDASSVEDSDDDMPSTGHYLAPVHGYTYQPVLNAPDRKKHPSPNKTDLELLETRLREHWPETLAQATEKAKKHPSPLKIDIQALGEQFRKEYPDLLAGNTPNHSEKGDGSYCVLSSIDETDELALSFVITTPEKRVVSRHRKTSSVSCAGQAVALEAKNKRKTIAMSKLAGRLNSASHLQLACPAYHQA